MAAARRRLYAPRGRTAVHGRSRPLPAAEHGCYAFDGVVTTHSCLLPANHPALELLTDSSARYSIRQTNHRNGPPARQSALAERNAATAELTRISSRSRALGSCDLSRSAST